LLVFKRVRLKGFSELYSGISVHIFYTVSAVVAYILCVTLDFKQYVLHAVPVSVSGGALAIFLVFRNSSAYDRWWEARKV
jgi:putative membrane protein